MKKSFGTGAGKKSEKNARQKFKHARGIHNYNKPIFMLIFLMTAGHFSWALILIKWTTSCYRHLNEFVTIDWATIN